MWRSSSPARSITSSDRPNEEEEAEDAYGTAAAREGAGELSGTLPFGCCDKRDECCWWAAGGGCFCGERESRVMMVVMPRGESPKKSDNVGASNAEASGVGRAKYGEVREDSPAEAEEEEEEGETKVEDGTASCDGVKEVGAVEEVDLKLECGCMEANCECRLARGGTRSDVDSAAA